MLRGHRRNFYLWYFTGVWFKSASRHCSRPSVTTTKEVSVAQLISFTIVMFHKVSTNVDLVNTEPLLLADLRG